MVLASTVHVRSTPHNYRGKNARRECIENKHIFSRPFGRRSLQLRRSRTTARFHGNEHLDNCSHLLHYSKVWGRVENCTTRQTAHKLTQSSCITHPARMCTAQLCCYNSQVSYEKSIPHAARFCIAGSCCTTHPAKMCAAELCC